MTSHLPVGLPVLLLAAVLLAAVPIHAAAAGSVAACPREPVPAPAERYDWPLDSPHPVTRAFEPPPQPWLSGHRGVDLGAAAGTTVRAAGSGVVAFAGQVAGVGVVSIDHGDGLRTTYEPVTPLVRAGQAVRVGQPVGLLLAGHPGCAIAACLHWGLRRGRAYVDPLDLLGSAIIRLLPLAAPAS